MFWTQGWLRRAGRSQSHLKRGCCAAATCQTRGLPRCPTLAKLNVPARHCCNLGQGAIKTTFPFRLLAGGSGYSFCRSIGSRFLTCSRRCVGFSQGLPPARSRPSQLPRQRRAPSSSPSPVQLARLGHVWVNKSGYHTTSSGEYHLVGICYGPLSLIGRGCAVDLRSLATT